jgi:hypothetical protein
VTSPQKPGVNARIKAAIKAAKEAPTARTISEATGIDCRTVSRNLGKLARDKVVKHAQGSGRGSYTTWALVDAIAPPPPAAIKPAWVGQVVPPRDKAPSTAPGEWPTPKPARADAADHERIPSRRGEARVPHHPLMLMGSSVRGEFGK